MKRSDLRIFVEVRNGKVMRRCPYCKGRKMSHRIGDHLKACMRRKGLQGEPKPPEPLHDDESRREDETHELASQLAGDEFNSINTSEIEKALEETKGPSQCSVLGKRPCSCSSQQLQARES